MDAFNRYYWDEQTREYTDSNGDECTCVAVVSDAANARIAQLAAELDAIKRTREQEADYLETCYQNGKLREALMCLTNGFKYSTEVVTIAREALGIEITSTSETSVEPSAADVESDRWAEFNRER